MADEIRSQMQARQHGRVEVAIMLRRAPGDSVHSFEVIGIDLSPVQIESADVAFSAPTLGEIHRARVNGGWDQTARVTGGWSKTADVCGGFDMAA